MNKYAVAVKSITPLRNEPSDNSERVDELLFGMGINIISEGNNGWYYVSTFYDYEGYINEKDIIFMTKDKLEDWINNAKWYIVHGVADIMKKPMYDSQIINTVTRGAFVAFSGEENGVWSRVLLPDGESGWVKSAFLRKYKKYSSKEEIKLDEEIIRKKLVDTAKLYLNTQYRWGGKSDIGIDCSGLCSIVYLVNGFVIHRDAIFSEKYMKKVNIGSIKSGDLLFFPGHIAMYIGNNKYIHSNSMSNGVSINSLNERDEDYRADLFTSIVAVGSIFE